MRREREREREGPLVGFFFFVSSLKMGENHGEELLF